MTKAAGTIRILLIDDHAVVREGYKALLEQCADLEVIAEAADGALGYRLAHELRPDVIVIDLSMPGLGGLETITRIRQRVAGARILVFTMHTHPSFAQQACQAGALGYVTKSSTPDDLVRAVRATHQGQRFLSADIAQALAWNRLGSQFGPLDRLSPREFEVLRLLLDAKSQAEIASTLNLSQKTVMNLHYIVKRKLGVSSDIELMRLAIGLNVVDLLELTGPLLSPDDSAAGQARQEGASHSEYETRRQEK